MLELKIAKEKARIAAQASVPSTQASEPSTQASESTKASGPFTQATDPVLASPNVQPSAPTQDKRTGIRVPLQDKDHGNIRCNPVTEVVSAKRAHREERNVFKGVWGSQDKENADNTDSGHSAKRAKLTTHSGRSVNVPTRFRE